MIRRLPPLLLLIAAACAPAPAGTSKPAAPAAVEHAVREAELTRILLRPEAEQRLGLATQVVARRTLPKTRAYGAVAEIPPGRRVVLTAPFAAKVSAPAAGPTSPGARVAAGQHLLTLLAQLSVERAVPTPAEELRRSEAQATLAAARADAEGAVTRAQVEADAARQALARAERLLAGNATSARTVEDARARLAAGEAALQVAKARRAVFAATDLAGKAPAPDPEPWLLRAPLAGVVLALHAVAEQTVAVAAPLCELADDSTLWVRVPVPDGEVQELDGNAPAEVTALAGQASAEPQLAPPVVGPPGADPASGSWFVHYALPNPGGSWRAGARVLCRVRTRAAADVLTVPRQALLLDAYGGTWVYVQEAAGTFLRTRVRVDRVQGDALVLGGGVAEGAQVVTDGAAELFGTEFGAGK